jgi:DNA-binding transcriptional ArsR family regulator
LKDYQVKKLKNMTANYTLPKTMTLAELLTLSDEYMPKFLIDKLLPQNGITYMFGSPGCGKSWLMFEVARAVSSGTPFLGSVAVNQAKVLIVDEENSWYELKRRASLLALESDLPIYFKSLTGFKLDSKESLEDVIKLCKRESIELVILDPFVAMHSLEENSATDMQKVMDFMQMFLQNQITVMFIHHSRKGGFMTSAENTRGSSAINGRADSAILVEKVQNDDLQLIDVKQLKSRRGRPMDSFRVVLIQDEEESPITIALATGSDVDNLHKKDQAKDAIVNILRESNCSRQTLIEQISEQFKIGQRNIVQALVELSEAKVVTTTKDGKQNMYSLTISFEADTEAVTS